MQGHIDQYPDNQLKNFSQLCCCTFKSSKIPVQKTVFFFRISALHPMYRTSSPAETNTQHLPTKDLSLSRVLPNNMPSANGMDPRAMSLDPLPVNPTLDPAICTLLFNPKP